MQMKEGNMQKIKGEAGVGILSSRFMLEGPILKNKVSFLVSARRTYADALVYPFLPKWAIGSQLPGMNDEKLYWNTQETKDPILPVDQPISDISYDYTVMFDIQVDNPTTRLGQHRIFLNRGSPVTTDSTVLTSYQNDNGEGNIQTLVNDFNFTVWFSKNTTDLCIATLLDGNEISSVVTVSNFPIQKSVRNS
jgi:hypothetical protein